MGEIIPKVFPPVTLHVKDTHPDDSTVELGWCISPKTIEVLRGRQATNPHLLISVFSVEKWWSDDSERLCERYRYLVPLKQGMCFVQFRKAGGHLVRAIVVWPKDDQPVWKMRDKLLEKNRAHLPIENHFGDKDPHFLELRNFCQVAEGRNEIRLEVDEKYFAKKPPKWLWAWVNTWHGHDPVDQCAFRRRVIFSFTLKPIILAPYAAVLIALRVLYVLLLFLVGNWRAIKLTGIFFPLTVWYEAVFTCVKNDWSENQGFLIGANPFISGRAYEEGRTPFKDKQGRGYVYRERGGWKSTFAFAIPIVLSAIIALAFGAIWLTRAIFGIVIAYPIPTLVLTGCAAILTLLIIGLIKHVKKENEKPKLPKPKKYFDYETFDKTLAPLVCGETIPPLTVAELPPERITIGLRFSAFKKKVCRPFAIGS